MSLVTGQITDGSLAGSSVAIEVPTVRVPELPSANLQQGTDLLVLYQDEGNVTTSTSLDELRDYIVTGGNAAALTPVVVGADVEITITAQMAGQSRVNVPVLANKMFSLQRKGEGWVTRDSFYILPSGGFELKPKNEDGDVVDEDDPDAIPQLVKEKEVFVAHVYDLVANTAPSNTNPSGLFSGIVVLNTDKQLSILERGKLIHAAFGSAHGTITLEDISDAPANSLVCIETMITNNFDTKIQTRSGQAIYFQNTSQDFVYLGRSEFIWLLRGDDGWYVTNCSDKLLNVGDISYGFEQKLGTLICKGQEVNRIDYPRLWQWVQSLGVSLVEESVWISTVTIPNAADGTRLSYKPYEGCFSYGSGGVNGTSFRLPNLQEKFVRGLNNITSTDSQRVFNNAGGIQPDGNRKHKHQVDLPGNGGGEGGLTLHDTPNTTGITVQSAFSGEYESRGINVGLLPLINT